MQSATLTIRNVPDDVLARLRARARSNGRSLEQEILSILMAAVPGGPVCFDAGSLYDYIRTMGLSSPNESAAMIRADRDGGRGH